MAASIKMAELFIELGAKGSWQQSLGKEYAYVEKLKKLMNDRTMMSGFEDSLKRLNKQRASLGLGAIGPKGGPGFAGVMGAMKGGPLGMLGMMGGPGMAIGAVAGAAIGFGGMANPVALERFNYVLRDVTAVLGRVFVPILNHMSVVLRVFGDLLANLLPSTEELNELFEPLSDLARDLGEAMMPLAQVIRGALIEVIKTLAHALRDLIAWVASIIPDSIKTMFSEMKQIEEHWDKIEGLHKEGKSIELTDPNTGRKWQSRDTVNDYIKEGQRLGISAKSAFMREAERDLAKRKGYESSAGAGQHAPAQWMDFQSYAKQFYTAALGVSAMDPQKQLVDEAKKHTEYLAQIRDGVKNQAVPAVGA